MNVTGHTLTVGYEFNTLNDFVSATSVPEYVRQLEQASDLLDFTIESYPPQQ